MSKHIIIFTDGACRGNPGPGGWAALLCYGDHEKTFSGAEAETTNNRMELTAAIEALARLRESCRVDLHTDSQYLQKGITLWMPAWKKRGWKKSDHSPVKNADLWKKLDKYANQHKISWYWVKAHDGHKHNERVDALARAAIDTLTEK